MGRVRTAANNMSIKMSFMVHMLVFIVIATVLSSLAINIADHIRNDINLSYTEDRKEVPIDNGTIFVETTQKDITYKFNEKIVINICDFVQTWSIPVIFVGCIVLSSLLFYRNKIKKPIEILDNASARIAKNDLDFNIFYDSSDEMGILCESFERMRHSLEMKNHEMWANMEEQKHLNAAFAHDLRTPLTVLKGYADILKKYVPEGKLTEEKIVSTVDTMTEHIRRLENYVLMMNEMQKLDDIFIEPHNTNVGLLLEKLGNTGIMLASEYGKNIDISDTINTDEFYIDLDIVIRVYENILSNALRFATSKIGIEYRFTEGVFYISVADDGPGFSSDGLANAAKPFYKNNKDKDGQHFGIGLHVCKVLCEKHGGGLVIENSRNFGAQVTASFSASAVKA